MPVSTLPTGTVPMPPILYTSWRGRRRGLSVGLVGGMMESRASSRVVPLALPSLRSMAHPLYQVLEGQTQRLVGGPGGGNDGVKGLQQGGAAGLALLALDGPSLVPGHVLGGGQHVVSMPAGDGDEGHGGRVITDLLDEARHFLLDLLKPVSAVGRLGGVHLVDGHDELLHAQGV